MASIFEAPGMGEFEFGDVDKIGLLSFGNNDEFDGDSFHYDNAPAYADCDEPWPDIEVHQRVGFGRSGGGGAVDVEMNATVSFQGSKPSREKQEQHPFMRTHCQQQQQERDRKGGKRKTGKAAPVVASQSEPHAKRSRQAENRRVQHELQQQLRQFNQSGPVGESTKKRPHGVGELFASQRFVESPMEQPDLHRHVRQVNKLRSLKESSHKGASDVGQFRASQSFGDSGLDCTEVEAEFPSRQSPEISFRPTSSQPLRSHHIPTDSPRRRSAANLPDSHTSHSPSYLSPEPSQDAYARKVDAGDDIRVIESLAGAKVRRKRSGPRVGLTKLKKVNKRKSQKHVPPKFLPGTILQMKPTSPVHLVVTADFLAEQVVTYCCGTSRFYLLPFNNCCVVCPRYAKRFVATTLSLWPDARLDNEVWTWHYFTDLNLAPIPYSDESNVILCRAFGKQPAVFLEREKHSVLLFEIFGLCAISVPLPDQPLRCFPLLLDRRSNASCQPSEGELAVNDIAHNAVTDIAHSAVTDIAHNAVITQI